MHLYRCKIRIAEPYTIVKDLLLNKCKSWRNMDALIEKKVGYNIRVLREARKMTQEQLSANLQLRGCDITRSALAKMEVGQRHIYPDELLLIKEILNVPFEAIFNMDD